MRFGDSAGAQGEVCDPVGGFLHFWTTNYSVRAPHRRQDDQPGAEGRADCGVEELGGRRSDQLHHRRRCQARGEDHEGTLRLRRYRFRWGRGHQDIDADGKEIRDSDPVGRHGRADSGNPHSGSHLPGR